MTSHVRKFPRHGLLVLFTMAVTGLGCTMPDPFGLSADKGQALAQDHGSGGGGSGGAGGGCGDGSSHEPGAGSGHDRGAGQGRGQGQGHASGIHGPAGGPQADGGIGRGGSGARGLGHVPSPVESSGQAGSDARGDSTGVSGGNLGRLNAARAFMSPGFDASKVGEEDEESPMHSLSLYQQELQKPAPDYAAAGSYLGNAATIAVTTDVVCTVNEMVGLDITDPDALNAIAGAAEQQRQSHKDDEEHGSDASHSGD